jgi:DNA-binding MarR family transcriptional regulator
MTAQAPTESGATLLDPVSWLMASRSTTRSTIVVGITLLSFQTLTDSNRYWVSIDTIAKSAGVSIRTAQRALKDLIRLGLVDVIQNPGYEHTIVLCDASRRLAPATAQPCPQPHHSD